MDKSRIRMLEEDDIPRVALLAQSEFPAHARETSANTQEFLRSITLGHPWADPDVPSLVTCDDDGEVVGFIASHGRRLRLGDRELRGAVCSHLVVDPAHRSGATGAMLLRAYLRQGQDVTFSDTATGPVARMWRLCGGHVDAFRSTEWMQLFRPLRWGAELLRRRLSGTRVDRTIAPVGAIPFHVAGSRLTGHAQRADVADVTSVVLTDELLLEQAERLIRPTQLRLAYDREFLSWLFPAVERYGRAPLVRRLVLVRDRPVGWFAYQLRPGGCSRALQAVAREGAAAAVLEVLFRHARESGSAALSGRAERPFAEALRDRLAVLGFGDRFVWQTRLPELDALMASPDAQLSRLDGEWW